MLTRIAALVGCYVFGALLVIFFMILIPPVAVWQVGDIGMNCLRHHFLSNQNYQWDLHGEQSERYYAVGGSPFGHYMPAKFAISFSAADFYVSDRAVIPFYGLVIADIDRKKGEWNSCD
jgi:hypothetical protein